MKIATKTPSNQIALCTNILVAVDLYVSTMTKIGRISPTPDDKVEINFG